MVGSVLGPILFLLYIIINDVDIPHDIKSVNYSKNVFESKVKSWLINQY